MSSDGRQERLIVTKGMWYGHEEMSSFQGYTSRESSRDPRSRAQVESSREPQDRGDKSDPEPPPHVPRPPSGLPKSRSTSAKRRPLTRGGSWDISEVYPQPRRDTASPDHAVQRDAGDTADLNQGQKSPRKSASYNNITTLDGYEIPHKTDNDSRAWSRTADGVENQRRRSVGDIRGHDTADFAATEPGPSRFSSAKSGRPSEVEAPPQNMSRRSSLRSNTDVHSRINNSRTFSPDRGEAAGTRNLNTTTRQSNKTASGFRSKTTMASQRRNNLNLSRRGSHKGRSFISRLSALSRGSNYFQGDFLDDNLLISASKLDSTLLRLFAHSRDGKQDRNGEDQGTALMPFLNYSQSDLISMDPVMWRIHPMEAAHRETLDQELPYIEESIQPRDVMKDLYQHEVLTHLDFNQLTRTEGQGERAVTRLMVKTLQRRGEKAYPAFIDALNAHQYVQVCERLSKTESIIRQGMMEDRSDFDRKMEMENMRLSRQAVDTATPFRRPSQQATNGVVSASAHRAFSTNQNMPPGNRSSASHTPGVSHPIIITSLNPASPANQQSNPIGQGGSEEQTIIDSEQLETFLRGLKAELEALHDDITALKSARSPSVETGRQSHSDSVVRESVAPVSESNVADDHPLETAAMVQEDKVDTLQNTRDSGVQAAPKSSSCSIL